MPRRRLRPPPTLPPEILPPDIIQTAGLIDRLYAHPFHLLTPPRPWAPLTDREWAALRRHLPGVATGGAGRPTDARARLDTIFRAVTLKRSFAAGSGRASWSALPAEHGKPDSVRRLFRRWAEAGLWEKLLLLAAERRKQRPWRGLLWRLCCAFRRQGMKRLGLAGIALARRLRLYSALPAWSPLLPDPDLSAIYNKVIRAALERVAASAAAEGPLWRPPRAAWRLFRSMLRIAGGRARISRVMEPA